MFGSKTKYKIANLERHIDSLYDRYHNLQQSHSRLLDKLNLQEVTLTAHTVLKEKDVVTGLGGKEELVKTTHY